MIVVDSSTHIVPDLNSCLLSDVAVPVRYIHPQMSTEWLDNSLSALAHLLVSEPKSTGRTSPGRADMTGVTDDLTLKADGRVLQSPSTQVYSTQV